ncbi:hypothetical protein CAPTEDRAFT_218588 [Capitella teleta]|uniref:Uncharacterized protein n=1 Tax=Capitella teleta TaxID=283909 RepID=R7TR60_CAPTE|nr:hypothetical protein CAPTEDRAFT_218588 [Capitella teleta]|eukprot:ELT96383.1 hypothetical protein CAPTEDRAFT_218588 [Capitella teleta]
MAAPIRNLVLTLGSRKCHILPQIRRYSIKPPPSLEKIIRYGALKPDQDDVILPTLEQRLQASKSNVGAEELEAVDIGVKHEIPSSIKKEQLQRWRKKRQGSQMERDARLQKRELILIIIILK